MPQSVIKRAFLLYRRRKFSQLIRLLESQIFRFRENAEFFFLLGSACLYSGDYGGAESYLKRADQLKPQDVQTLLGLAAVHAKRAETDAALKVWLQVLELEPGNRQAHRGLETLRRADTGEALQAIRGSKKIEQLYPPIQANPRRILFPIITVAAIAVIAFGLFYLSSKLSLKNKERTGISAVSLSSNQPSLITAEGSPQFVYSEKEIQDSFERTKKYLLQYRDNLALREINRILLSNASSYVKEKARLLKSFVQTPDFSTITDTFSFAEVRQNPLLYSDCFVVWSGKVANVRLGAESITFELLVGYQDEKELEGVVPVTLGFAFDLENGVGVEVLGRVVFINNAPALQGKSIHRLYNRQ